MSADSLMTIYGDDGPCDLYRGYDNVASGSREAMRAAERLLSGRCEAKPFPLELAGHWARATPPFRQEYDLHFVPDSPVGIAACPPAETIGVNFCYPAVRAVDTVAPLHNDDEPGQ